MRTTSIVCHLPGFDDSLRLLVEREQYSLTDIAMMFGVTREAIRLHATRLGVQRETAGPVSGRVAGVAREWDDEHNRFRSVRRAARLAALFEGLFKKDIRAHVREQYRAHLAAALRSCYARTQRPVTAWEWWFEASGQDIGPVQANNAIRHGISGYKRDIPLREFAKSVGVPFATPGWNPSQPTPLPPVPPEPSCLARASAQTS